MASRKDIERMRSEMEELFADLCQVPRLVSQRRGFRPAVDVYRTESPPTITVVAELAGVDPTDVEIAIGDGFLVLSGERRRERRVGGVYQQMEIDYGRFHRRIALGGGVDEDGVEATYARGLLTIVLPLARRRSRPVRVTVTRKEVR